MLANGIKETTTTTGTDTVTLSAVIGFTRFANAFANGLSASYVICSGNNWEWGIGTVGAGNTLARTVITATLVAGTYTASGATAITLSGTSNVISVGHTGTHAVPRSVPVYITRILGALGRVQDSVSSIGRTIFRYGWITARVSMTNLVSNTGVVSTDTPGIESKEGITASTRELLTHAQVALPGQSVSVEQGLILAQEDQPLTVVRTHSEEFIKYEADYRVFLDVISNTNEEAFENMGDNAPSGFLYIVKNNWRWTKDSGQISLLYSGTNIVGVSAVEQSTLSDRIGSVGRHWISSAYRGKYSDGSMALLESGIQWCKDNGKAGMVITFNDYNKPLFDLISREKKGPYPRWNDWWADWIPLPRVVLVLGVLQWALLKPLIPVNELLPILSEIDKNYGVDSV